MDQQGFDFKPKERRDPKKFVPPPWEQDTFDELRRHRPEPSEAATGNEPEPEEERPAERPEAADGADGPREPKASEAPVDEGAVIEMLAGLAAEEPPANRGYLGVAIGAALVLFAMGGMLLIWGMAALVGARQTGFMGQVSGVGLGMFGVFFLGMGVWLMYRTLKQRGVL